MRRAAPLGTTALYVAATMLAAHYGYDALAAPHGVDAQKWASWWFYALRGVEGTVLFLVVARMFELESGFAAAVGSLACWIGAIEESHTALCSINAPMDIDVPLGSGLCIQRFGVWFYWPLLGLSAAYLLWRISRDRKS